MVSKLKSRTKAASTVPIFASERENNFSALNSIMTTN
jgi:hypothetical protein